MFKKALVLITSAIATAAPSFAQCSENPVVTPGRVYFLGNSVCTSTLRFINHGHRLLVFASTPENDTFDITALYLTSRDGQELIQFAASNFSFILKGTNNGNAETTTFGPYLFIQDITTCNFITIPLSRARITHRYADGFNQFVLPNVVLQSYGISPGDIINAHVFTGDAPGSVYLTDFSVGQRPVVGPSTYVVPCTE